MRENHRILLCHNLRRHPIRDETIILTSFYAGLRAKEMAALTGGNVFDEACNVRTQFILKAEQSKGGHTRTVYLNQRLRKALLEYSASIRTAKPHQALFKSQKGGHFSTNTMCQLFLDIYKAMGLKDASSHSGRRTYITRLANKGVGVLLLAEHSHISTTQRYIDVNAEQLSDAVEPYLAVGYFRSCLQLLYFCSVQRSAHSICRSGYIVQFV